jgi:L,D-peptidoglycan transpeptidase YkuD (ErfK/YbiS/YcfS/YnhG family)
MSRFLLFIFFMILSHIAFGSQQLVVVIASDMNATSALMTRYEKEKESYAAVGSPVPVVLGRSGLGWDHGAQPLKHEGDGRSPAGVFGITATFGEDQKPNSALNYWYADEKLMCVDDVNDSRYNTMVYLSGDNAPKSYEWMRRGDDVYRNGAVIDYNPEGVSGRGSCIFFHLNHPNKRPTSGCTAMEEQPLSDLLGWLDPNKKPLLLQIPQSECERYQKEFRGIECQ